LAEERRQSLQPQFDRLADLIGQNHEETVQRLTRIETHQKTDRKDIDELTKQCGEHEKTLQRGRGIIAFLGFIGALGVWDWFTNHIPKLSK
jgi:hypothetical protein